jgi:hypothetical protein
MGVALWYFVDWTLGKAVHPRKESGIPSVKPGRSALLAYTTQNQDDFKYETLFV